MADAQPHSTAAEEVLAALGTDARLGLSEQRMAKRNAIVRQPRRGRNARLRDRNRLRQDRRPRGEGVITGRMWAGILYVGIIMAVGTLLVLDYSLPAA